MNVDKICEARAKLMNNGKDIETESLYDFVSESKLKIYDGWTKRHVGEFNLFIDDQHHINSIEVDHNYIYCTMFGAFDHRYFGKTYKGIMYNMTTCEPVIEDLDQPHTGFMFVVPVLQVYGLGKDLTVH